jgi:hypothetical protein
MKRRLRNSLAFVVLAVTLWMCWDNVISDDEPIRAVAEKAACTHKKCSEQHGLVREQRWPWGQTIDYAWRDGTIRVSCHRAYLIFGERQCAVE